jgi:hypothetical protein
LLLWLTARLDHGWSRRRLLGLCLACVPLVLVSHATVFVAAAALGGLAVRALAERRWRQLGWIAAAGLGVAAVAAAAYLAFAAAGNNPAMRRSWADDMIPLGRGLGPAADFVAVRSADALGQIGFGPWPLATAVVAAGLVALWRARLAAVAAAVCLLAVELLAGAIAQRYPFLDDRTSLFFTTLLTVCGALGVASLLVWSARRNPTLPLGIAVAVAAGALLVPAARAQALQPMPPSSIREQVAYVLAHRRPGDTIVVGSAASFPFAYYWPERPTLTPTTARTAVLFQVDYPRAARPGAGAEAAGGPDRGRRPRRGGQIQLAPCLAGPGRGRGPQPGLEAGRGQRRPPHPPAAPAVAGGRLRCRRAPRLSGAGARHLPWRSRGTILMRPLPPQLRQNPKPHIVALRSLTA